jgi:hypothetical protein
LPTTIVLDQYDGIVSREGGGASVYLKACKQCGVLVEHVRITRAGFAYAYVPLADHDSQCRA